MCKPINIIFEARDPNDDQSEYKELARGSFEHVPQIQSRVTLIIEGQLREYLVAGIEYTYNGLIPVYEPSPTQRPGEREPADILKHYKINCMEPAVTINLMALF